MQLFEKNTSQTPPVLQRFGPHNDSQQKKKKVNAIYGSTVLACS